MNQGFQARALLVVDHDLLAHCLSKLLALEGVAVDRRRSSAAAAMPDLVRDGGHHLVLLDLDRWAEPTGLRETIESLTALGTPVMALAGTDERERQAVKHGARGIIRTDRAVGQLRETVVQTLQTGG